MISARVPVTAVSLNSICYVINADSGTDPFFPISISAHAAVICSARLSCLLRKQLSNGNLLRAYRVSVCVCVCVHTLTI